MFFSRSKGFGYVGFWSAIHSLVGSIHSLVGIWYFGFHFSSFLCILRAGQPHIFAHTGYEKGERKEKIELKMKLVDKTCFCFGLLLL